MPSAKKSKLPSHQVFGVFALEANKILQSTPSKLRRSMGMCATATYIRTASAVVLYDTSTRCTYSSFKLLVPGAAYTWYLVLYMQAPSRLHKSEVRESVSRVKTPCEQGLPHYNYVLPAEQPLPHATEEKAKRSFPMERGPNCEAPPCVESAVNAAV